MERQEKTTDGQDGKLLFTRLEGRQLALLLRGGRLIRVQAQQTDALQVGEIILGKVRSVRPGIAAAFVDMGEGRLCFVPLDKAPAPLVQNRVFDGCLRAGDEMPVEIVREAAGVKEAAGDTGLSFPGQYAVVTIGRRHTGFSGKLPAEKRRLLRGWIGERFPDFPYGLVVRTNAGSLTDFAPLEQEIRALSRQAQELLQAAAHRTCFSRLRSAPPLWEKVLRDTYQDAYAQIVTDDPALYEALAAYLEQEMPQRRACLQLYQDAQLSLSALYGLEGKLREAFVKKVWLRSGGFLMIEPTEALTAIDVNSGKYTGKGDPEATYRRIDLEACEEIARQLILRNLSGIILVDFINLRAAEDRSALMAHLRRLLAQDPVHAEAVDMTALGLVEITRKKISKSLAEQWGK